MRLLMHGIGVQSRTWHVCEKNVISYSRVYYILSGDVTYRDCEAERKLSKGKMYVFPTNTPYVIEHDPDHPIECLWFHFDLFPYSVCQLLEFDPLLPEQKSLCGILEALRYEFSEKREKEQICFLLEEALELLICRDSNIRRPDPKLIEILEYIRENLCSPQLSVVELSKRFNYSAAHFIRWFRAKMGITPYCYILGLRLSVATISLTAGKTVSEVAAECGYDDVKTFSRAFKKNYGVSPSLYSSFYHPQA